MDAGRWLLVAAVLSGLFFPVNGIAQSGMDSLLEKRVVRCEDVAVNAMVLFADKVAHNDLDSAELVLEYWEQKCPANARAVPFLYPCVVHRTHEGLFSRNDRV